MRKGTLYCALDITAGKIAAVAGAVKRNNAITDIVCLSGPSAGISNGSVKELGELAEAIAGILKRLSQLSGSKIKYLYACLLAPHIKSVHSFGALPLSERSHKIITSGDIAGVNKQAYGLGLSINEQVLHQAPQGYTIDNHNKVFNPEGLYGHKLEVDLLLITARNTDTENLISAVERAGYRTKGIVLSAYATALAVVAEVDKLKGCALVDIGFDTTQILVFKDGVVRGFEAFSRGSNHITEALAGELKLPPDMAETVKTSYGNAFSQGVSRETEALIKKDGMYRPIKQKEVCAVIERELDELFSEIRKRLEVYQRVLDLPAGIIASGKIALLEGFLESLEHCLCAPVRLAKIGPLGPLSANHRAQLKLENDFVNDLTYATAIGALRYAVLQQPAIELFRPSSYGSLLQKVMHKTKEIYQEYF